VADDRRCLLLLRRQRDFGRSAGRAAVPAVLHSSQELRAGYGVSHTPIHCEDKAQTEREARYAFTGWSAQCDRHGAFKPKPSVGQTRHRRTDLLRQIGPGPLFTIMILVTLCHFSRSYSQMKMVKPRIDASHRVLRLQRFGLIGERTSP